MGIFNFFRSQHIDRGVEEWASVPGAVLLDVRTPQEYREGHIPGSKNLPLRSLDLIGGVVNGKNVPLYVYCQSGVRSSQAVSALEGMGYEQVNNIGGISFYSGSLDR